MPTPRRVIVFDLDGTLVDSIPDILASFRAAFGLLGMAAPPLPAVKARVGAPLEEMYAAFAPEERVAELAAAYRVHYPEHYLDNSRPFPGVTELLAVLAARGYGRAVATTKRTEMARAFVAHMGLSDSLDYVQGTDAFPHKPAPDVILRALAAVGGAGAWMVGDSPSDIQAGRAAGLKTYAVSWGAYGAEDLAAAEPDELQPNLDRLLELV